MVAKALVISSCEGQGGGLAGGVHQDGCIQILWVWVHVPALSKKVSFNDLILTKLTAKDLSLFLSIFCGSYL